MPKYVAKRDTWLSHECRTVKAGEVFETTFPKVKTGEKDKDGKPIEKDMKLSDNIELAKPGKKGAEGDEGGAGELV